MRPTNKATTRRLRQQWRRRLSIDSENAQHTRLISRGERDTLQHERETPQVGVSGTSAPSPSAASTRLSDGIHTAQQLVETCHSPTSASHGVVGDGRGLPQDGGVSNHNNKPATVAVVARPTAVHGVPHNANSTTTSRSSRDEPQETKKRSLHAMLNKLDETGKPAAASSSWAKHGLSGVVEENKPMRRRVANDKRRGKRGFKAVAAAVRLAAILNSTKTKRKPSGQAAQQDGKEARSLQQAEEAQQPQHVRKVYFKRPPAKAGIERVYEREREQFPLAVSMVIADVRASEEAAAAIQAAEDEMDFGSDLQKQQNQHHRRNMSPSYSSRGDRDLEGLIAAGSDPTADDGESTPWQYLSTTSESAFAVSSLPQLQNDLFLAWKLDCKQRMARIPEGSARRVALVAAQGHSPFQSGVSKFKAEFRRQIFELVLHSETQCDTLNLRCNGIGSHCLDVFTGFISLHKVHVKHLIVSENALPGVADARALAGLITHCPDLEELDAQHCSLSDEGNALVLHALAIVPRLTRLSIGSALQQLRNDQDAEGTLGVTHGAAGTFVGPNRFGAAAIEALGTLPSLCILSVGGVVVEEEDNPEGDVLRALIASGADRTTELLDCICALPNLEYIDLQGAQLASQHCRRFLCNAEAGRWSKLVLADTLIPSADGAEALIKLLSMSSSLQHLDLSGCFRDHTSAKHDSSAKRKSKKSAVSASRELLSATLNEHDAQTRKIGDEHNTATTKNGPPSCGSARNRRSLSTSSDVSSIGSVAFGAEVSLDSYFQLGSSVASPYSKKEGDTVRREDVTKRGGKRRATHASHSTIHEEENALGGSGDPMADVESVVTVHPLKRARSAVGHDRPQPGAEHFFGSALRAMVRRKGAFRKLVFSSVSELILNRNVISLKSVEQIALLCAKDVNLKKLHLRQCKMDHIMLRALLVGVRKSAGLTELDLAGNEVGDEGMRLLVEVLVEGPSLHRVSVAANGITDLGGWLLAASFHRMRELKYINVSFNELTDVSATYLFSVAEAHAITHRSVIMATHNQLSITCQDMFTSRNSSLVGHDLESESSGSFNRQKSSSMNDGSEMLSMTSSVTSSSARLRLHQVGLRRNRPVIEPVVLSSNTTDDGAFGKLAGTMADVAMLQGILQQMAEFSKAYQGRVDMSVVESLQADLKLRVERRRRCSEKKVSRSADAVAVDIVDAQDAVKTKQGEGEGEDGAVSAAIPTLSVAERILQGITSNDKGAGDVLTEEAVDDAAKEALRQAIEEQQLKRDNEHVSKVLSRHFLKAASRGVRRGAATKSSKVVAKTNEDKAKEGADQSNDSVPTEGSRLARMRERLARKKLTEDASTASGTAEEEWWMQSQPSHSYKESAESRVAKARLWLLRDMNMNKGGATAAGLRHIDDEARTDTNEPYNEQRKDSKQQMKAKRQTVRRGPSGRENARVKRVRGGHGNHGGSHHNQAHGKARKYKTKLKALRKTLAPLAYIGGITDPERGAVSDVDAKREWCMHQLPIVQHILDDANLDAGDREVLLAALSPPALGNSYISGARLAEGVMTAVDLYAARTRSTNPRQIDQTSPVVGGAGHDPEKDIQQLTKNHKLRRRRGTVNSSSNFLGGRGGDASDASVRGAPIHAYRAGPSAKTMEKRRTQSVCSAPRRGGFAGDLNRGEELDSTVRNGVCAVILPSLNRGMQRQASFLRVASSISRGSGLNGGPSHYSDSEDAGDRPCRSDRGHARHAKRGAAWDPVSGLMRKKRPVQTSPRFASTGLPPLPRDYSDFESAQWLKRDDGDETMPDYVSAAPCVLNSQERLGVVCAIDELLSTVRARTVRIHLPAAADSSGGEHVGAGAEGGMRLQDLWQDGVVHSV